MSKQFVPYFCEIVRDQTKLLLGTRCMNPANFQDSTGFLICHDCLAILDKDPERLTLPKPPFGMLHQQKKMKELAAANINRGVRA